MAYCAEKSSEQTQRRICVTHVDTQDDQDCSCSHSMCQRRIESGCIEQSVVCTSCWKLNSLSLSDSGKQTMPTKEVNNDHLNLNNPETKPDIPKDAVKNAVLQTDSDSSKINSSQATSGCKFKYKKSKLIPKVKVPMNDYLNQVLSPKKCSQTTKDYIRQIELLPSFGTAIILHQENQYFSQSDHKQIEKSLEILESERFPSKFTHDLQPNRFYEGKIIFSDNPYRIYLQINDGDVERLKLLNQELQTIFSQPNFVLKQGISFNKGCACAVLYESVWHRAVVEMPQNGQNHKMTQVFFVDTGRRDFVIPRHVQFLPRRFLELPAQAVLCKLGCIPPLELKFVTSTKSRGISYSVDKKYIYWPSEVVNLVNSKQNKTVRVFVEQFTPGGVGNSAPVEESSLLTTMFVVTESKSINQQVDDAFVDVVMKKNDHPFNEMVRDLYANPSTSSEVPQVTPQQSISSDKPSISSSNSSTLNSAIQRKEKIPLLRTNSQKTKPTTSEKSFVSDGQSKTRTCKLVPPKKPIQVDKWAFPQPNTVLAPLFQGIVTWIDDHGNFYIHDKKWSEQLLHIRDSLNAQFFNVKPSLYDLRCKPGDPCIAKYNGDWFRAVVKKVSERTNSVTVLLVDYGVTENVGCCEIRRDILLTNIPVQTFCCILHNIKPLHAGKQIKLYSWPVDTIDSFHEVAVNQEFNVQVKSYSPLRVSLNFPKNSVDLTDFLVAARKAEYQTKS